MSRLAALVVPLFPLAARLRSEPQLMGEAVVITEGNGHAARVVCATRKARLAGLRPGMTLPQSRALLPNLLARGRDTVAERAAEEALFEVAESFSPRVEAGEEPGLVLLDIAGLERLFPKERELGQALIAAAEKAGLPARAGLAGSKLAARVAAELPTSPTLVPEGGEAAFLAPLPLARLHPDVNLYDTLARWGIRSIGALARLHPGEVATRLGAEGRKLHELARGLDPAPLLPRTPPESFSEGMELEWPLTALEPFLALSHAALGRLVERLSRRALSCARLELSLRLEPDGHDVRAITLPAPTRDVKTLVSLLQIDLERKRPGAPVAAFTLTAYPDRPRLGQLTLFGPVEISPDMLATTLAKLFALLGEDRVGAPATVNGHRPERFALKPYAPPPAPLRRREVANGRGLLAVRVLRPAVELEVLMSEERAPDAALPLRLIRGDGAEVPDDTGSPEGPERAEHVPRPVAVRAGDGRIQGSVRVASGPWQLEEAWWSEAPVTRDYWDVELDGGGLYRIFRERRSGAWFADGTYD